MTYKTFCTNKNNNNKKKNSCKFLQKRIIRNLKIKSFKQKKKKIIMGNQLFHFAMEKNKNGVLSNQTTCYLQIIASDSIEKGLQVAPIVWLHTWNNKKVSTSVHKYFQNLLPWIFDMPWNDSKQTICWHYELHVTFIPPFFFLSRRPTRRNHTFSAWYRKGFIQII